MFSIILSTVIGFVFGALAVYFLWRVEVRSIHNFLFDLQEYLEPKKNGTAQKAARIIGDFLAGKGYIGL